MTFTFDTILTASLILILALALSLTFDNTYTDNITDLLPTTLTPSLTQMLTSTANECRQFLLFGLTNFRYVETPLTDSPKVQKQPMYVERKLNNPKFGSELSGNNNS